MRLFVLTLISLMYLFITYAIANKLQRIFQPERPFWAISFLHLFFLLCSLTTIAAFLIENVNWGLLGTFGMYWFGLICVSSLIFFVIDSLIWIFGHIGTSNISEKGKLLIGIGSIVLIVCCFIYGMVSANRIVHTTYEVKIEKKSTLDSLKIVMFSDLHLGYVNGQERVDRIVEQINQLQPDIVLIAGDFFDGNLQAISNPNQLIESFQQLSSTYGNYLILGNHDAGDTFLQMLSFIQDAGIEILSDEAILIDEAFYLIGRKDLSPIGYQGTMPRADLSDLVSPEMASYPVIVMDHQPSPLSDYQEVDLILSGHTHQGQLFPFSLVTKAFYEIDYGHLQAVSGEQIIVSSGVGTWGPPLRLGTASEIVTINVTFD